MTMVSADKKELAPRGNADNVSDAGNAGDFGDLTDLSELVKRIDQQRLTIFALLLALVVTAGYACLAIKREHAASRTAGAYWESLFQEREDRKLDLEYIRTLEAKVEEGAAQSR